MSREAPSLFVSEGPWVLLDSLSGEDINLEGHVLYGAPERTILRRLRGSKMRTLEGLMNEFGAALQFFDGFGENWPALSECLAYLDEWMKGDSYILIFNQATELLADDELEARTLLRILNKTGEWWSRPIIDNGAFNRPAIPFHSILQVHPGEEKTIRHRFGEIPSLRRI